MMDDDLGAELRNSCYRSATSIAGGMQTKPLEIIRVYFDFKLKKPKQCGTEGLIPLPFSSFREEQKSADSRISLFRLC
jgi:hypothetical protein